MGSERELARMVEAEMEKYIHQPSESDTIELLEETVRKLFDEDEYSLEEIHIDRTGEGKYDVFIRAFPKKQMIEITIEGGK